jgi:tRNA (guanine37-N1)-methyltransferase
MVENIKLNGVTSKVFPLLGDAKEVIQSHLQFAADRVLMPLPELALQYLPSALSALKSGGGWIHYHDFQHAAKSDSPLEKTKAQITEKLAGTGVQYRFADARIVRSTGPNWWHVVVDLHVTKLPSKF